MNISQRVGITALVLLTAFMQTAIADTASQAKIAGTLRIENKTDYTLTVTNRDEKQKVTAGASADIAMSAADITVEPEEGNGEVSQLKLSFNPGNCSVALCLSVN
ncbi:SHS2 domain-containing protein [Pseudomonas marginalis]|uniref:hypothetical protein n=1 Tax=Pseudomonas TaxID=286 RepID=UPI00209DD20F|nr:MULTISPECIES: hypothetical protein [Pseudomonas]MCP1510358.1 SHS2 domain-containing protein [Pseudomonas marginalis]MCP1522016.1 SHS2 domain-containing protein [Pseudomonas marginalis]MDQ0502982.1 SHS2 domain-containing protein [Pseudomonas marginalis]